MPKDLPAGKTLPLVVCLHGAGGGTHAAKVLADPEQQKKRPCFMLAPACEGKGNRWVNAEFRGGNAPAVARVGHIARVVSDRRASRRVSPFYWAAIVAEAAARPDLIVEDWSA